MRYLLLLVILLSSCGTYKVIQNKNIETKILTFLYEKQQITQQQKKNINDNFNGYITIVSLQQQKFDNNNGVYVFSVNSSHNYKFFLLHKSMDFKIIDTNDNLETIKKEIIDYGIVLTDFELDTIRDIIIFNNRNKERFFIKKLN